MHDGRVDVLVAGAGPAGLALALQAHDHGARVRIVERRIEPFRPSRALIVHPRTLEVVRPLGVTDALLAGGDVAPSVHLHLGRREVAVRLGGFALPDTAFPHLLFVRQSVVEAVLSDALQRRGIEVERGVEVVDLRHGGDGAEVRVRRAGAEDTVTCKYLAGCDGAASIVRRLAGVGWKGGDYRQEVVLADLDLDSALTPDVAHVVSRRRGLLFLFALQEQAPWRLLATRPRTPPAGDGSPASVPTKELQDLLDDSGLEARISDVAWSGRVPLQHRMATHYRRGPLFLVGDAAHVHSPAGGQGMNTGIQDALNLGWKLAYAAQRTRPAGSGTDRLLDSYETERRPVGRSILRMTHALFWAEAATSPLPAFGRAVVLARLGPAVPRVLRHQRLVARGVRTLSQLRVQYRHSPLSVDASPPGPKGARAGDRVPDAPVEVCGGRRRLHELLAGPGISVLLERDAPAFDERALGPKVRVHRILNWPGTGATVVRPDGYVGFGTAVAEPSQIVAWLALVGAEPVHASLARMAPGSRSCRCDDVETEAGSEAQHDVARQHDDEKAQ